jgi:hypothetical protein
VQLQQHDTRDRERRPAGHHRGYYPFGRIQNGDKAHVGHELPDPGGGRRGDAGISRIFGTSFSGNVAGGLGGGISNLGTTSLTGSVIRFNKGSGGGGIATGNTNVRLRRTVVRNNTPDNCNPLNTIPGCHN